MPPNVSRLEIVFPSRPILLPICLTISPHAAPFGHAEKAPFVALFGMSDIVGQNYHEIRPLLPFPSSRLFR
jgi:hypothetical protein